MIFENVFCNFISFENIMIDNEKIKNYCYSKRMENEKGRFISNIGGWQSDNLFYPIPELEELTSVVISNIRKLEKKLNFKNCSIKLNNFWININNYSNSNSPHIHPDSVLTSIYYVKVPINSGSLKFSTPVTDYDNHFKNSIIEKYNEYNSSTYLYIPKQGDLVFFPSWLMHEVEPNKTNEERISIAFNTTIY